MSWSGMVTDIAADIGSVYTSKTFWPELGLSKG